MASTASRQAFTVLSRSYSTQPPKATAKAAKKASLPLQVALRREQQGQTNTKRVGGTETTYKRAVVGLVEPFIYPNAVEDMTAKEREENEAWMEKMFQTKTFEKWRKEMKQDSRTGMLSKRAMSNRGHILEKVMQKRKERDELMKDAVQNLVTRGASPFGAGSLKVAQAESTEA
ncbi:hypothetical protein FRC00_002106 [Tulasnella sp. 408]|nr:hypothetical protein FRC00_002106 [Tulasnella sp. 408]